MRKILAGITLAVGLAIAAAVAYAATALPIPSGVMASAGQIVTAIDGNNIGLAPSGYALQVKVYSQTITPAQVNTIVCAEQDFTVTGLTTADTVFYNGPANSTAAAVVSARVKAADTLSLTFCNPTAGNLTPTAGTAKIIAVRF